MTTIGTAHATLTVAPHPARTDIAGARRCSLGGLSSSPRPWLVSLMPANILLIVLTPLAQRQPGCRRCNYGRPIAFGRGAGASCQPSSSRLSAGDWSWPVTPEPQSRTRALSRARRFGTAIERHGGGGTNLPGSMATVPLVVTVLSMLLAPVPCRFFLRLVRKAGDQFLLNWRSGLAVDGQPPRGVAFCAAGMQRLCWSAQAALSTGIIVAALLVSRWPPWRVRRPDRGRGMQPPLLVLCRLRLQVSSSSSHRCRAAASGIAHG